MDKECHLAPFFNKNLIEVGCDEAGRGCLAGPVFAAAVILPRDFYHPLLNDSKKLTDKQRDILRPIIEENAIAWSVQSISPKEIDTINILNASILAMHNSIDGLKIKPEYILVDGNRFKKYKDIPHSCIVKGDSKFASIAAASILAKTHRDEYMKKLSLDYPQYGWDKNMAYPTKVHRKAIEQFGVTPHHRMSYKLIDDSPTLF